MNGDGWQTVHDYAADLRIAAVATWRHGAVAGTAPPDGTTVDLAALAPTGWAVTYAETIEAPTTTKDGT